MKQAKLLTEHGVLVLRNSDNQAYNWKGEIGASVPVAAFTVHSHAIGFANTWDIEIVEELDTRPVIEFVGKHQFAVHGTFCSRTEAEDYAAERGCRAVFK